MRDYSKRIYLSIFWIIVGAALFAAGSFGKIDSFWSGMGGCADRRRVSCRRFAGHTTATIRNIKRSSIHRRTMNAIVLSQTKRGHGQAI